MVGGTAWVDLPFGFDPPPPADDESEVSKPFLLFDMLAVIVLTGEGGEGVYGQGVICI